MNDKSIKVGGKQHIKTNGRFTIPISIKSGLPYIPLRPYSNSEWEALSYIVLTLDIDWDPSALDCPADNNKEWFDAQEGTNIILNSPLLMSLVIIGIKLM